MCPPASTGGSPSQSGAGSQADKPAPTEPAAARLARAKLNYALHVTGRRADGYHMLQSLVAFAEFGDTLSAVTGAPGLSLALEGPFASALSPQTPDASTGDNLVLRAVRALAENLGGGPPPPPSPPPPPRRAASGSGGGPPPAAAALHLAFAAMTGRPAGAGDMARLEKIAERLGADVPMCLASKPALVSGTGTEVASLPRFPGHAVLLANPGLPVATPDVFARLACRENPPLSPLGESDLASFDALIAWLEGTRNDLEAPALTVAPQIAEVLAALRSVRGARLARMSGSGATCFALFAGIEEAEREARRLTARHPAWWVQAAPVAAVG